MILLRRGTRTIAVEVLQSPRVPGKKKAGKVGFTGYNHGLTMVKKKNASIGILKYGKHDIPILCKI